MSVASNGSARQAFPDPVPGIIDHGSVNLMAGASGIGKTCLTASLLQALRQGVELFGHTVNPPTAMGYVGADRGQASAQYWLGKVGYPDIPYYSLTDDPDFSPGRLRAKAQLISLLGECIAKLSLPPGALVVVDPVALFLGGNLMDYHACAVALIELRRLCLKFQYTMIGLAHSSKQKGDKREQYVRLQDRIMGSGAQLGYGDTQMYLAGPQELNKPHFIFMWHPHTAPAEEFKLGRNKEGLFVPWEDGVEVMQMDHEAFLKYFPDPPNTTTFGELVLKASEGRTTVHRRLLDLVSQGRIERVGHGAYRRVPAH